MEEREKSNCSHPRLFYFSEDIRKLQARLGKDRELRERFQAFEEDASPLMDSEFYSEAYANSVYSQHGRFYELGDQVTVYAEKLGFLYQVTGKREYAGKIREALFHYAAFEAWTGPANRDRRVPWHSDLSTTKMAYGCALGLDCIADILSPEEEAFLREALFQKGIFPLLQDWVLPESRIHALDSMGHNWWAVCVGMAVVSLAAVYEKVPGGADYLKQAVDALEQFVEYPGNSFFHKVPNFDRDGMFYESAGYFNYGAGEWMRAAFVVKHCLSGEIRLSAEKMAQAGEASGWMLYETSGREREYLAANFGDSSVGTSFSLLYSYLLLCGTGGDRKRIQSCYASMQREYTALDFIYCDILRKSEAEEKKEMVYPLFRCMENYLFMRSPKKAGGTLFAARCGSTWNHAHEDAGSFLLFDRGQPLLSESGAAPSYDHGSYLDYYVRSRAHNVLLVGDGQYRGDIFRGTAFPGSFPVQYEDGRIAYAMADATGPMSSLCDRNYRSFLKLEEDIFLVVDDVHAYRPENMAFLLHYQGTAQIREGGARIENGVSGVEVDFYTDGALEIKKQSGFGEAGKGQEPPAEDYLAAEFTHKREACMLMSLLRLNEAGEETELSYIPDGLVDVLEIFRKGKKYKICLNRTADGSELHMNSIVEAEGMETDAYLLVLWEADGDSGYVMINGSFLRNARTKEPYYSGYRKGQVGGRLQTGMLMGKHKSEREGT